MNSITKLNQNFLDSKHLLTRVYIEVKMKRAKKC